MSASACNPMAMALSAGGGRLAPAAIPILPAEGGNDMSPTIGAVVATTLSAGIPRLAPVTLAARHRHLAAAATPSPSSKGHTP